AHVQDEMAAGDAQTLSAANAYTDQKFAQVDFSGINDRFDAIDRRFGQQNTRISRVGAMGLAASSMNAHAVAADAGRGRFALGIGSQGGKNAVSVGYGKRISRATLSLGGAFSGSDKGVTAGFGLDL
ncbi:MAG TPA: YadA-like family protein, partial [Luteimonas sp.]|nr:YadA-like family protein [Luteimonas sp.]